MVLLVPSLVKERTLVNRLGQTCQEKVWLGLTDRSDMISAVYHGLKQNKKLTEN